MTKKNLEKTKKTATKKTTKKKKGSAKKKTTTKKKNKGGRPPALSSKNLEQIELLAGFGLIDRQIAQVLGICEKTLNNYKKKPEFLQSLKKGKLLADVEVIKSLHKRATGYTYDEVTREPVILEKVVGGKKKKKVESTKLVITKIVTKQVAPDTTAGIYWSKNRMKKDQGYKDDWRDKQELALSGEVKTDRSEVMAELGALDDKKKAKVLKVIREAMGVKETKEE